jgi:hypothetical protein
MDNIPERLESSSVESMDSTVKNLTPEQLIIKSAASLDVKSRKKFKKRADKIINKKKETLIEKVTKNYNEMEHILHDIESGKKMLLHEETKPEEVKTDLDKIKTKTEETKTEEVKTEEVKTEEVKTEEVKTDLDKIKTKTEETKTEETKTEETKTDLDKIKTKTEETKTEETKTDLDKIKTKTDLDKIKTKTEEVKTEETKTEPETEKDPFIEEIKNITLKVDGIMDRVKNTINNIEKDETAKQNVKEVTSTKCSNLNFKKFSEFFRSIKNLVTFIARKA